jgi:hypothetical protein
MGFVVISKAVYPAWIAPYLTLDERIAERKTELDRLQELEERVERARKDYQTLVARAGSFDIEAVQTDVWDRVNGLIEKHQLQNVSVTPGRQHSDRKTKIESKSLSVSATGTLESTIRFLEDLSELPHVVRVGTTSFSPARSGRTRSKEEIMKVRVPLELIVLPPHKVVGKIDPAELARPEQVVRNEQKDYSRIWLGTPFTEYEPTKPLIVEAGPDVDSHPGITVTLRGTVRGGNGEHTYTWSPTDALATPTAIGTRVDTREAFERVYTLTVTDERGQAVSDTVKVSIADRVAAAPARQPPPPPPPVDPRWPERRNMQIVMTLGNGANGKWTDELMVYNTRTRDTTYYAVGDEFDGGNLIFVHQTGGLVHRKDEYSIYPIGARLDQDVPANRTEDFPELTAAAEQHRRAAEATDAETLRGDAAPDAPRREAARTVSDRRRP